MLYTRVILQCGGYEALPYCARYVFFNIACLVNIRIQWTKYPCIYLYLSRYMTAYLRAAFTVNWCAHQKLWAIVKPMQLQGMMHLICIIVIVICLKAGKGSAPGTCIRGLKPLTTVTRSAMFNKRLINGLKFLNVKLIIKIFLTL